jgi:hypothetical protein
MVEIGPEIEQLVGRKLLEVCGSVGGNDICHGMHRIFCRDKHEISRFAEDRVN